MYDFPDRRASLLPPASRAVATMISPGRLPGAGTTPRPPPAAHARSTPVAGSYHLQQPI